MVKTPKKAAPVGDEKNARRIRTTNTEITSLPNKRNRESENTNRSAQKKKVKESEEQSSGSKETNMLPETEVVEAPIEEKESKIEDDDKKEEEALTPIENVEQNNGTDDAEDALNESQTDTESYSVDIVESTTSEISELSQNDKPVKGTEEGSFALKDVQIKLNDCLKDNGKQGGDDSEPEPLVAKDLSFGQSLRSISGRNSLGRMRNHKDCRFSPDNSLYVNTSSLSSPQGEESDYKIPSRFRGRLLESLSTNGAKRKIDAEPSNLGKRPRIDTESNENGFLSSSISALKGFRRPVQVSTPNYKFQSNDDDKVGKKWCSLM